MYIIQRIIKGFWLHSTPLLLALLVGMVDMHFLKEHVKFRIMQDGQPVENLSVAFETAPVYQPDPDWHYLKLSGEVPYRTMNLLGDADYKFAGIQSSQQRSFPILFKMDGAMAVLKDDQPVQNLFFRQLYYRYKFLDVIFQRHDTKDRDFHAMIMAYEETVHLGRLVYIFLLWLFPLLALKLIIILWMFKERIIREREERLKEIERGVESIRRGAFSPIVENFLTLYYVCPKLFTESDLQMQRSIQSIRAHPGLGAKADIKEQGRLIKDFGYVNFDRLHNNMDHTAFNIRARQNVELEDAQRRALYAKEIVQSRRELAKLQARFGKLRKKQHKASVLKTGLKNITQVLKSIGEELDKGKIKTERFKHLDRDLKALEELAEKVA